MNLVLSTFNEEEKFFVHIAGEMICNYIRKNLCSKYNNNCNPNMKI